MSLALRGFLDYGELVTDGDFTSCESLAYLTAESDVLGSV